MSSNYKFVILEVRPRLRSINVFVTLNENHSVDVALEQETIKLIINNQTKLIKCKNLNIVSNSLTSFNVTEKCVTFRCATDNSSSGFLGGFRTEFLQNTVASIESLSNKPLINTGVEYIICCQNCDKELSESKIFDRILPLPSEGSNMSDWFCHSHDNEVNLDPKETDIFYTHCMVHVNLRNIINIRGLQKVFACKFCLSWLGVKHNSNTIKLWLNTVKFLSNDSSVSTSSLVDVFHSIKSVLKHSSNTSARLIITCQTTSSQVDTLLLWILEKKLQILFDNSKEMGEYDVAKVLFKFETGDNKIVLQWQNDPVIHAVNVSKPMFLALLAHLHKFHKILPEAFSKSNDFKISYLFLYNTLIE